MIPGAKIEPKLVMQTARQPGNIEDEVTMLRLVTTKIQMAASISLDALPFLPEVASSSAFRSWTSFSTSLIFEAFIAVPP
jgi:hypothetical protein